MNFSAMQSKMKSMFPLPDQPLELPEPWVAPLLLERSSPWLAAVQAVAAGTRWRPAPILDLDEFNQQIQQSHCGFGVIETTLELAEPRLRLVRQLVRSHRRRRGVFPLAVVGSPDMRHHEWTYRAAGAVACCWQIDQAGQLAELAERVADWLPTRPVTAAEFIFHSLPWPQANSENPNKKQIQYE